MFNFLKNKDGSAIVIVLIMILILSSLGVALLRTSLSETQFVNFSENKLRAHYYARSGVEAMLSYVNNNNSVSKDLINEFLIDIDGTGEKSDRTVLEGANNGFELTIDDISEVDSDRLSFQINAIGYHLNDSDSLSVQIKEIMPYDYAIFSNDSLDVQGLDIEGPLGSNGSIIPPDDHDDEIYEYSEITWDSPLFPGTTLPRVNSPVEFPNNAKIEFEVEGVNTQITLTRKTVFLNVVNNGDTDTDGYIELEPNYSDVFYYRDFDAIAIDIVFITKTNLETRVMIDNFELGNNSQISILGNGWATIFVNNYASIDNGTTGFNSDPNQLAMFMDIGSTLDFSSNSTFNGFIYAPDVDVTFGSSSATTINGSIISNSFEAADTNGGIVHIYPSEFDHPALEQYLSMGVGSTLYRIEKWK